MHASFKDSVPFLKYWEDIARKLSSKVGHKYSKTLDTGLFFSCRITLRYGCRLHPHTAPEKKTIKGGKRYLRLSLTWNSAYLAVWIISGNRARRHGGGGGGGGWGWGNCPPMCFFFAVVFLLVSSAVGDGHDNTPTPFWKLFGNFFEVGKKMCRANPENDSP